MKFKLQPYSIHELGQRENQEDSMFPAFGTSTPEDRLFILCDGMGGHEKGEVASAAVCEAMSKTILSRWSPAEPLSDDLLLQAIEDAYDALDAKDNGEAKKMGTTMTFICFHANGVTVAHIGDSRVYQLRPATKSSPAQIVFKTQDHSLVNDLIKIGEITEAEAKTHPQKNVITRAMQPCQERRAKADIAHLTDIQPGDYFYMCSDGMLEQTSDENLLYIITKQGVKDTEKVEMLRKVTGENKDNHTAHLIYVNKVEIPKHASIEPKGTWITPEREQSKNRLSLYMLFGIIMVLIVGVIGGYFFRGAFSNEAKGSMDSTQMERNHIAPQRQRNLQRIAESTEEKKASFVGGQQALEAYISKNMEFPEILKSLGVKDTIVIAFTVKSDSSISNVQMVRGKQKQLVANAIKIVKSMPKWIPSKRGGKNVDSEDSIVIKYPK